MKLGELWYLKNKDTPIEFHISKQNGKYFWLLGWDSNQGFHFLYRPIPKDNPNKNYLIITDIFTL